MRCPPRPSEAPGRRGEAGPAGPDIRTITVHMPEEDTLLFYLAHMRGGISATLEVTLVTFAVHCLMKPLAFERRVVSPAPRRSKKVVASHSEDVCVHHRPSVAVRSRPGARHRRPTQRTRPLALEPFPDALLAEHVPAPQPHRPVVPLLADGRSPPRPRETRGLRTPRPPRSSTASPRS